MNGQSQRGIQKGDDYLLCNSDRGISRNPIHLTLFPTVWWRTTDRTLPSVVRSNCSQRGAECCFRSGCQAQVEVLVRNGVCLQERRIVRGYLEVSVQNHTTCATCRLQCGRLMSISYIRVHSVLFSTNDISQFDNGVE